MIDTHCHLQFNHFDRNREMVIKEAREVLDAIIISGTDREDAEKALQLREKHPDFIYATLGLHPTRVIRQNLSDEQIQRYMDYIRDNQENIIAIGEIGLDYKYFNQPEEIERMKQAFVMMLELADELNLPVVLHMRKALEDGFQILLEHDVKQAIFHCWSGSKSIAQQVVDAGYNISIATNLFRSKNARRAASSIPLEFLLTETDAPYLHPTGERLNTPANIKPLVEKIAETREISAEEVDRITTQNARRVFRGL